MATGTLTRRTRSSAPQTESDYFDSVIRDEGEFNPFADRGWMHIAQQVAAMVPLSTTARILDVGCGTGQSRKLYAGANRTYVGMDLSGAALSLAQEKFRGAASSCWVRGDACHMPVADRQFDLVAFSSVLHHIDNFGQALHEARRVLRPGGYVFAFDPNLLHPAMALFRHPRSPFYLSAGVSPNERPLLPQELSQAFREAGLQDIRQRCLADIPYRAVAPKLLNACLGIYNICDRLMEQSGLGRWFGSFVLTVGKVPDHGHNSSAKAA